MTAPDVERAEQAEAERDRLREAVKRIHRWDLVEVESYCGDWPADAPGVQCDNPEDCFGHIETTWVCTECGHDHDDGYPTYRTWPCPTLRAALGGDQ